MPYETITFNGKHYPALQAKGFAAQFAIPFAKHIIGEGKTGYDVGCNRKEWSYPNSMMIDPALPDCRYSALDLPDMKVDYFFSSHMLEHVENWVSVLDYWATKLHSGGILFLYLPHPVQEYWLPHNNRKHIHTLFPDMIAKYLNDRGIWDNIFTTGYDLNCSYYVIANKR